MHTPLVIYLASILGAIALLMMLPKPRYNWRLPGAVAGAAAVGALWLFLAGQLDDLGGITWTAFAYYYVFSGIAFIGAVRVITHTRPVYAALWFVMVLLASAGLLVTLMAEFMAFAMIIIYAGAILVTYMFVLMLAAQTHSDDSPDVSPHYDRVAREPVGAVIAGFLLLAVLLSVVVSPDHVQNEAAAGPSDEVILAELLGERPQIAIRQELGLSPVPPGQEMFESALGLEQRVSNVERVGLDLFQSHPLGLELAGVILLVALIGAVVIAKTRVPEEEGAGREANRPGAEGD